MLCQNCRNRDATVHLKRVVNGESMELHLCAPCAAALGYSDIFSGFGVDLPGYLSALDGAGSLSRLGSRQVRCETCGFSLEDVAAASRPGCPDCYRTFRDKLVPYLQKLHGKTTFAGEPPVRRKEKTDDDEMV